jgi:hypothetical protein
MTTVEVAGIPLNDFRDPLEAAFRDFADARNDDRFQVDSQTAIELELTPDKPYAARSEATVRFEDEPVGTLHVIAFAPKNGTGNESTFKLGDVDPGKYPHEVKILPRSKTGVAKEVHIPLITRRTEDPNADFLQYAGNLSLLGVKDGTVVKIGEVGQREELFTGIVAANVDALPWQSLTVGYVKGTAGHEKRFGDPHSVYNDHPDVVQVCGFIAISDSHTSQQLHMVNNLSPVLPSGLTTA